MKPDIFSVCVLASVERIVLKTRPVTNEMKREKMNKKKFIAMTEPQV